ncbi:hypothetical protein INR49_020373 [Caranx melampygus]|nr:hypothetical protein INR49_020373 [Caranx melampygus]
METCPHVETFDKQPMGAMTGRHVTRVSSCCGLRETDRHSAAGESHFAVPLGPRYESSGGGSRSFLSSAADKTALNFAWSEPPYRLGLCYFLVNSTAVAAAGAAKLEKFSSGLLENLCSPPRRTCWEQNPGLTRICCRRRGHAQSPCSEPRAGGTDPGAVSPWKILSSSSPGYTTG